MRCSEQPTDRIALDIFPNAAAAEVKLTEKKDILVCFARKKIGEGRKNPHLWTDASLSPLCSLVHER